MILPKSATTDSLRFGAGEPSLTRITTSWLYGRPRAQTTSWPSSRWLSQWIRVHASDRANRRLGAWQGDDDGGSRCCGHAMGAARNLRGAARHAA